LIKFCIYIRLLKIFVSLSNFIKFYQNFVMYFSCHLRILHYICFMFCPFYSFSFCLCPALLNILQPAAPISMSRTGIVHKFWYYQFIYKSAKSFLGLFIQPFTLSFILLHIHPNTFKNVNPLTPNDIYIGRTAPLTSRSCILYI
jgi:hypothetical protein